MSVHVSSFREMLVKYYNPYQ